MLPRVAKLLVLYALVTSLCGATYLVAQQHYRQDANDPQIQMAEDIKMQAESGQQIILPTATDISRNLDPFVIIVDKDDKVVTASGMLNGEIVLPPTGSFAYAAHTGQNRITWQPAPGVRLATVIEPINGGKNGYVLAGRSLKEVEQREDMLTFDMAIAWVTTLAISTIFAFL